jgi:hypothetical protein
MNGCYYERTARALRDVVKRKSRVADTVATIPPHLFVLFVVLKCHNTSPLVSL